MAACFQNTLVVRLSHDVSGSPGAQIEDFKLSRWLKPKPYSLVQLPP